MIKGSIQARQRLIGFDEIIGEDGIRRCGFMLDPELVRTTKAIKRPFQGWRYLEIEQSPADLKLDYRKNDNVPTQILAELADIGVR